ncbi:predicted protein [Histoplasma mississippiense (nom. inval.)]|uniref:predicted protein n=1 Tax=Ajellomyces capsulatus (strain NAm1 / WU24) TaxID=2059318 RepID=UPI000157B622|nr:predicted protein [Histoplasma mississippiense (nom. inval.)]EDN02435.1 predicted protein [Histoplasma mississippiense (nom. inval.)]
MVPESTSACDGNLHEASTIPQGVKNCTGRPRAEKINGGISQVPYPDFKSPDFRSPDFKSCPRHQLTESCWW